MKKATSIIVFKNIKEKLQIYMIKRSGKSRFMAGGKNKKDLIQSVCISRR
jgi:hypothetical protein